MLNILIHVMLIVTYVAAGVAVGGAARVVGEESWIVSSSLGGVFILLCGLLHLASQPKATGLSPKIKKALEGELDALKEAQLSLNQEIENLKTSISEDMLARDAQISTQMREIAQLVTNFAQKTDKRIDEARTHLTPAPTSRSRSDHALLAAVKAAIADNRVELHVQPVVTLPQRKVMFYEGYSRLRDESGAPILPGEFLRVAEASGLVAEIDNMLLLRCVQIARRMIRRDRRVTLFCNVSPTSLADEGFFAQFIGFLRENRELSGALIFELTRDSFDNLPLNAERNLGRLFDIGYRFSLDRCDSIDLDLRKLERMGVRYVKMAGDLLVHQVHDEAARPVTGLARDFTAQDVTTLFARYGVDLIADRVENEQTVIKLLELDIGFAQGNLFGAPKPVDDTALADDSMNNMLPETMRRIA